MLTDLTVDMGANKTVYRRQRKRSFGAFQMPEFILDRSGVALIHEPQFAYLKFADLDSFTQGYIEALFFTNEEDLAENDGGNGDSDPKGFSDLAPDALAQIIADCAAFQASDAYKAIREAEDNEELGDLFEGHGGVSSTAGRDFWYTRCGHGCGFWDGDWPEPYASALDALSDTFGNVDAYLGDDGKVYLS